MKYESGILKMIHENAVKHYKYGIISEEKMREYDELCLAQEKDTSTKRKKLIRKRIGH
ncbi:MAG: hypothetical protein FWD47_01120 [Treponema sp.]|nr:hypothetical protein [Treponema sp.]